MLLMGCNESRRRVNQQLSACSTPDSCSEAGYRPGVEVGRRGPEASSDMLTAIVIPADPEQPVRLEQLGRNDLDTYRHLGGGNIEHINLERPVASVYFNEEGKLVELPSNPRATALSWGA